MLLCKLFPPSKFVMYCTSAQSAFWVYWLQLLYVSLLVMSCSPAACHWLPVLHQREVNWTSRWHFYLLDLFSNLLELVWFVCLLVSWLVYLPIVKGKHWSIMISPFPPMYFLHCKVCSDESSSKSLPNVCGRLGLCEVSYVH